MSLTAAPDLITPVIDRAHRKPDQRILVFMAEDGTVEQVTAAQFHEQAVAFARALQAQNIQCDDLVVVVLRHSKLLLSAFWGSLYLGAIPSIFPFLTEKLDPDLYMQRVRALVEGEGVRAVITFPEFKADLAALLSGAGCQVLSTDEVDLDGGQESFAPTTLPPEKVAFLQHSSGTTGLQKGVALSHQAVLNQARSYSKAIALTAEDVVVSWLPLYHDMGLIAGFVMPILTCNLLVMMSPFHWVRQPQILLQAIHDYGGTLCWLPNFAFNHCARSIRKSDLEGLDLSTWRAAINCSEPVRHDSHQIFLERFGPYGFREETLSVSYAMAENTFAVTQTPTGQPPYVDRVDIRALTRDGYVRPAADTGAPELPIVSCGSPIENCEVAVIDDQGHHLADRQVGELIVRSDSMLTGYYARPDLTAEALMDGWYRTGDMGYMADGQVFVTGRKKDLMIVGGKNVYPQDVEAIANGIPGIYPGRVVAFSIDDERQGTEAVVVVAELENHADSAARAEIERSLRRKIVEQMEITLRDVQLVERRWLIKTSSGKIARNDNRAKYLKELGLEYQ